VSGTAPAPLFLSPAAQRGIFLNLKLDGIHWWPAGVNEPSRAVRHLIFG